MLYRLAADAVLILHLAFILSVVLGGALVLRWPRLALIHLPTAVWGATVEFLHLTCPLTPLENHFRHLAGLQGYSGGFIENYLLPVIYPSGLTPSIQIVLGSVVVAVNLAVYLVLLHRLMRLR